MASIIAQHIPQPPAALIQSGSDYVSDNNEIKIQLTKDAKTGANVVVFGRSPGAGATVVPNVQWFPRSLLYIDDNGLRDIILNANNASTVATQKGTHARYPAHFANVDDWFKIEGGQIKHYITLQQEQRAPLSFLKNPRLAVGGVITIDPSYSIVAMGQNVTKRTESIGSIEVHDANGLPLFTFPQVEAWDQNGNKTDGTFIVSPLGSGQYEVCMCIPNTWVQQSDIVFPVIIDPTTIVASAYDTSGNGGRKIIRLSNNWIVTCATSGSTPAGTYFYVSKDNGQTWSQLCYVNAFIVNQCAIASSGTMVYWIGTQNNQTSVVFTSFDATTVTNTAQSIKSNPDTNQTGGFGSGCSLAIDSTGKLWAAWCSKNSTYANAFNLRVSSSTDGGATWATPTQVTTMNNASYTGATNPCVIIQSNNNPIFITQYYVGTYYVLAFSSTFTSQAVNVGSAGGTLANNTIVYSNATYTQYNPCAAIDGNGTIHVVWHGMDATNGTNNIKYSKSTDGGNTWSSVVNLTTGSSYAQTNPTLTIDPNNNLYVFWQGVDTTVSSYVNIRKIIYTGGSWGSIATITNDNVNNAQYAQTLWSMFNMNSSDAIRYMYQQNQANPTIGVIYDSITLNSPPNAPTLTPKSNFDATTAVNFAWTFSDPDAGNTQSAYQLQIYDPSTSTTVLDTGKVASTSTSYTLAASTLANGKNYQWRVSTWDNSGAAGPYSTYSSFSTAAAPSVSITSPANAGTVNASSVTASWNYSDPGSNAQTSFDLKLEDASGNPLWDSTTVNSSNNQMTVGYTLANNTTYKLVVTATNSKGISTTSAVISFTTSFTPPSAFTITATPQTGFIALAITNPATGTTVTGNDVYRRLSGVGSYQRIATNIPVNGTYNDYAVASGQAYDYQVVANGNNQTSTTSPSVTSSVTLSGLWIHDPNNPSGTILNVPYSVAQKTVWKPEAEPMKFAGRNRPLIEFGEQEEFTFTPSVVLPKSNNNWNALNNLIRSKTTLCFRDATGRKVFGAVLDLQETDELWGGQAMDLPVTEVSYSEVV